jgi:hypothetical protein
MRHRLVSALASLVVVIVASTAGWAAPMDFSFTGTFSADDEVQTFNFTANGASTITLRTYSYAGGTQADGNVVSAGGFDPILALFDSTGLLIDQNDDGDGPPDSCFVPADPATSEEYDTCLVSMLPAGDYTVAIMQFDNFASGPNLSDGFDQQGDPTFTSLFGCSNDQFCDVEGDNRTNFWAFDILGVEQADLPEPSIGMLLVIVLTGLHRRCRRLP